MENKLIKESLKRGIVCFKALGNSMFPFVRNGDLVIIKHINPDNLSVGDIIFFEKENTFFLHRLLKKNEKVEFITKGDNRYNFDTPINSYDILGKLIIIKRDNRVINLDSALNKIMGKLIVVFYPLTYLITRTLINSYQLVFK